METELKAGGGVQSDLKNLLALQEVDRRIMLVEEELRSYDPELEALDAEVERLEREAENQKAHLSTASDRRSELETRIETYRVMQERRRQKLEWVRGAKEASALMAEIDMARGVLAKEEAEWVRSADEVQEIATAADEAAGRVDEVRGEQAPRRAELAGLQDECRSRLEAHMVERKAAMKEVKPRLLAVYDRIRRGRAQFAMYELHGQACGQCYTAVPMHLRQQIQRGDIVATCEVCGVIMYHAE